MKRFFKYSNDKSNAKKMVCEWYGHKKPHVYTDFKFQYTLRNVKFSSERFVGALDPNST